MAEAAHKFGEDSNSNARWQFSTGNYNVATNLGVYLGTIVLTMDGSRKLSPAGQWTPAAGSPSSASTTWDGETLTIAPASGPSFSGTYEDNSEPDQFSSSSYIIESNPNVSWAGYPTGSFSVRYTDGNNNNYTGSIVLAVDAANNLCCIAPWDGDHPETVTVLWQNNQLSWSCGSGDGQFKQGSCPSHTPTTATFNGQWSGDDCSPKETPNAWTATH